MKIFKYILTVAIAATLTVSCDNDDDFTGEPVTTDFSGTFTTQDQMGRPGINTVFGGTDMNKNNFNVTTPSSQLSFQPSFQNQIEAYYAAYSNTAGTTLTYENNILGLDLPTLTTALSIDVLQVTPDAPTSYFTSTSNFLTGRAIEDDVIDVSLILLFGGANGDRFTSPTNLVSDNVAIEPGVSTSTFPYLTPASF